MESTEQDPYEAFAKPLQLAQKLKERGDADFSVLDSDRGLASLWAAASEEFYNSLSYNDPAEASAWALERNTWRLLHDLYTVRTSSPIPSSASSISHYISPRSVIGHLLADNPELTELEAIREWLHSVPSSLNPVEVRRGYLRNTANTLKYHIRSGTQLPKHLVNRLDPDSLIRDNLNGKNTSLTAEDSAYESALLRSLFEYIRAGELEYALDLCRQSDQSWRAATLIGGKPYYDSRLDPDSSMLMEDDAQSNNPNDLLKKSGNPNRLLWKSMCRHICLNTHVSNYERALYGAISGDVDSVLLVCSTWEDQLWAYINALFESEVDNGLQATTEARFWSDLDSTQVKDTSTSIKFNNQEQVKFNLQRIFSNLKSFIPPVPQNEEAAQSFHSAQELIILDEIDTLLVNFVTSLESSSAHEQIDIDRQVRFFAHMVLFLRLLGYEIPEDIANTILEYYVKILEHEGKDELVAFYAASLTASNAIRSYANYLASLPLETPKETRRQALFRAAEQGLDLDEVARKTVFIMLQDDFWEIANIDPNSLFTLNNTLEPRHKRLIYTIEWLTFDESTYKDALKQANALIRWMLTCGSTNAAKETLRVLPDRLLSTNIANIESVGDYDYADIKERDHFANFITCVHLHTEWTAIWSQRPTTQPYSKAQFSEYVESLLKLTDRFYDAAIELLNSEWLIPDPSMLVNQSNMDHATERRITELRLIRQIYIPEMLFRLHQALFETREYSKSNLTKSLDLVNLVANENSKLWHEFVGMKSNRMGEFLQRIRSSSMALLKLGSDPFV